MATSAESLVQTLFAYSATFSSNASASDPPNAAGSSKDDEPEAEAEECAEEAEDGMTGNLSLAVKKVMKETNPS